MLEISNTLPTQKTKLLKTVKLLLINSITQAYTITAKVLIKKVEAVGKL